MVADNAKKKSEEARCFAVKQITIYESMLVDKINKIKPTLKKEELDCLDDFIDYWTEKNEGARKERWELQKTFDVKKRLSRWIRNDKKWNGEFKKELTSKQY